uniref:Ig-like domain-containing protein n=1 Tax=Chelonoidis abingdonii TaxID=106734 RepID=A0A8C0HBL6_CHEAB
MAWAPLLLTLLTYCSGSLAQYVLTQPPSVSVSPGQNAQLTCSGNNIGSKDVNCDYAMSWYQQKPGNSPRTLLYYDSMSNKDQGSGVPAHFSGSKDAASNTGYLTIAGALTEDDAHYYYVVWSGSAPYCDTERWRSETKPCAARGRVYFCL